MATMASFHNKLLSLEERLIAEKRDKFARDSTMVTTSPQTPSRPRPKLFPLTDLGNHARPRRPFVFQTTYRAFEQQPAEFNDWKLQDIMKQANILTLDGKKYDVVQSDLEQLGELGNGTCGHVVKMKHKESGKVMAVKQMRRSGDREENKRITMDLDVVLKCGDCPHIVHCYGWLITEADVWICMELMATCMDRLLRRLRAPIPERILGKMAVETVKALHYLKEKHGVIHRDVKPSNILLDERGNIKLCDFGISGRLVDSKARTRSAGCAAYLAPERINPPNPEKPDYDIRADVWSLGISMVELATGHFPYRDCKTEFEVMTKVLEEDPPRLPSNTGLFTPQFCDFVDACLTKDYRFRPKYNKLLEHPFIRHYEVAEVDVAQWYSSVIATTQTPRNTPRNRRH